MDCGSNSRAAKVSHVQTALDLRTLASCTLDCGAPDKMGPIYKYYYQRHRLFHRFDEGICLDEESWYSVTPEKIAKHIAHRFNEKKIVMELFGGAGGNSIQFALRGAYVIAVEISASKIAIARNNAAVYGVADRIEFIQADVYEFLPQLAQRRHGIEGIFLSPPWGGPQYKDEDSYDVGQFEELVAMIKKVSPNISILLPRNSDLASIRRSFGACEVEKNFLSGKLKTLTVYMGDLVDEGADWRKRKTKTIA
eukprot:GFKZ01012812.1.p1 GENE.GFKZ01012812.1~~GFKZ01012812.1.p1  ORF type:complete len:252 (-),score=49.62 GFKZ01012812.1:287-1042(-)